MRKVRWMERTGEVFLTCGVHAINVYSTLTGDRWRFEPVQRTHLFVTSLTLSVPLDRSPRPYGLAGSRNLTMALLGCWPALPWSARAIRHCSPDGVTDSIVCRSPPVARTTPVGRWRAGAAALLPLSPVRNAWRVHRHRHSAGRRGRQHRPATAS
jgi:hypothetical protein